MSTARGSASRTRKQAHQNSFAFRHNKHSTLTEKIKAAPNEGLCPKCHEKVEWRKKYRKYKPLTQPKKWFVFLLLSGVYFWIILLLRTAPESFVSTLSVGKKKQTSSGKCGYPIDLLSYFFLYSTKCELKKVRHAYHTICEDCAISLKCCAKCLIPSGSVKSGVIKYVSL
jgi:hypothetical protein